MSRRESVHLIVAGMLVLAFTLSANARVRTEPQQDQWKFADEDEVVPSWTDDLKDQAVSLTMFAGFATLALVSFFRKSERLKWITIDRKSVV